MATYTGHCHCAAVKYTFTISPGLEEQELVSCNCSYCSTTGALLLYPKTTDFSFTDGADNLTEYRFATGSIEHLFCKVCGTNMTAKSLVEGAFSGIQAVNARTLDGIDLENMKVKKVNGKDFTFPSKADGEK
ncbi:Mss4-like protein [Talaromyces proteolyticus]|uniref:Mss4-like protein n=1 Tax=Talaromyces proteolyticus TaxID=1131652 RepID=A0AAD4Q0Q4_9EURO|nr:Mss4-like protein [Talaromyces proteolyticus]KAH8697443.1 Mss4-like protein [Talaromyces proteolyticus]